MNFTDALDKNMDDIEPPKLLPIGTYVMAVTKSHTINQSTDGLWEFLSFPCKVISAEDDVDPDDLEEFGKVSNIPQRVQFIASTDPDDENSQAQALYNIKRFIQNHLQIEADTLKEGMANAVNTHFLAVIKHRPDKKDPTKFHVEISSTAPLMD